MSATNFLQDHARERALAAYLATLTSPRVLLIDDTSTPTKTMQYVSELSGELTCTGYTRKTLAGLSTATDHSNHLGTLTFTPPVWAALGPSSGGPVIGKAIIYDHVGADSANPIIAVMDVGLQTNGGQFTLNPNATYSAYVWVA
jgi:hypothetical protein